MDKERHRKETIKQESTGGKWRKKRSKKRRKKKVSK
jgi:hypothetical protein